LINFEIDYEKGLKLYDSAFSSAEDEVIRMGLPLSSRPSDMNGRLTDIPDLPPDISLLKLDTLQRLLGQFTAWYDYANGQLRLSSALQDCSTSKAKFAWAKIRSCKEGTVDDKNDATRTDSRYVTVDTELHQSKVKTDLLSAMTEGLKRKIETVSRTITALDERMNVEGRQISVTKKQNFRTPQESAYSNRVKGCSVLDVFKK
jgi:hypothetical protein